MLSLMGREVDLGPVRGDADNVADGETQIAGMAHGQPAVRASVDIQIRFRPMRSTAAIDAFQVP